MSWVGRWARIAAGIAGHGPRAARLRRAVQGRVVLVTGASEGIGAATARRLGAAGATVLLVARTAERLEAVRRHADRGGGRGSGRRRPGRRGGRADPRGAAVRGAPPGRGPVRGGVRPRARVGVACGAQRGFAAAVAGVGLLGADAVLIPPDLPPPPLADLLAAQGVTFLVHDGQFPGVARPAAAWSALLAGDRRVPPPPGPGRLVVLTSGTTGAPRGVIRRLSLRTLLGPVTTHLRLVALRPGVPLVVAAPPHHGYGLSYVAAGLTLGAPVVLGAGRDATARRPDGRGGATRLVARAAAAAAAAQGDHR